MTRRALGLLAGALVVLLVIAGVAALSGRGDFGSGTGSGSSGKQLLLPALKDQLNDISRIVVTGPGDRTIATLERGADRWTVAERSSYPADVGRLRKNLLALADARIVEEKTSNPEFYDRLGVEDITAPAAKGIQLALTGTKEPVTAIIGLNQPGSSDLTYVRLAGVATSWLVSGQFDIGRTSGEWLDRTLTDIPLERLRSVTITHPGSEPLRIERAKQDAAEFTVPDLPAGRELSYPGVANSVAGVLADLQLEDVLTRDALGDPPGTPVVARFVTTDGLTVETRVWRVGDATRVTFTASGTGAAEQEAKALNDRLGAWVYTLPGYKTEQLTRRLQDLLAPPAP